MNSTFSKIQFLTGEKLWNRKIIDSLEKDHYVAIKEVLENSDKTESDRFQRSYQFDPVHEIYRLNVVRFIEMIDMT